MFLVARIRSIKPEFWRSPDVMELDFFERLLFIGLWNLADDEGRGEWNPKAIAADLFLSEYSLSPHGVLMQIENALTAYSNRAMIRVYHVKNRDYFEVVNWADHQRINRPTKSKIPPYDQRERENQGGLTEPSVSPHGVVTEGSPWEQGTGNREQGTGKTTLVDADAPTDTSNPAPTPKPATYPPAFEEFWSVYPKRAGKAAALKAWKTAIKKARPEDITAGAARYASDPNRSPEFTKNAQGWLNDGRWEDDPLPARSQSGSWRATKPTNSAEAWLGLPENTFTQPPADVIDGTIIERRGIA